MKNSRIFITGATGFVGASLVRHFAAMDWEVLANGRAAAPVPLLSLAKYVQADIQNPFPPQSADVLIHAAALASDAAGWDALKKANLEGTRHVFEATRDCPCFVYISSSSVYDGQKALHREDEIVDRSKLSPYGLSKRMAEDWLLEQDWQGRSLFILRPRAVYGVGDRVLLPRLLRLVRQGQIFSPGDMRISSSLTHVDNLCAAIDLCVGQACFSTKLPESLKQKSVQIFNVADDEVYEMRELVCRLLSEIHGRKLPFRAMPLLPLRYLASALEALRVAKQFTPYSLSTVSKDCVLDIEGITKTLEYRPRQNFCNTLPEIVRWVNRVGIERVKKAEPDLPWQT
ncbi:MAG: NAD(P)-dependent oxidoreductase [Phycisphaerae bacterium]|nr:NAD(P)-dependent oxidoreductase [Saprospiraceae bacterium]